MLTEVKNLEKIKCVFFKFIIKSLIANTNRCVNIMLNIFAYVDMNILFNHICNFRPGQKNVKKKIISIDIKLFNFSY